MDAYSDLVAAIISHQEQIIGPLAVEEAKQVDGLRIDWDQRKVSFSGDKADVTERLVEQYQHLFGQTSVEVCKEAASPFVGQLKSADIPPLLR